MERLQFTTRDLLLSITLVTFGVWFLVGSFRFPVPISFYPAILGMTAIGAGVFAPFHKVAKGAAIGMILAMILFAALATYQVVQFLTW